eukprot:2607808-Amphidinium_carterae.1
MIAVLERFCRMGGSHAASRSSTRFCFQNGRCGCPAMPTMIHLQMTCFPAPICPTCEANASLDALTTIASDRNHRCQRLRNGKSLKMHFGMH